MKRVCGDPPPHFFLSVPVYPLLLLITSLADVILQCFNSSIAQTFPPLSSPSPHHLTLSCLAPDGVDVILYRWLHSKLPNSWDTFLPEIVVCMCRCSFPGSLFLNPGLYLYQPTTCIIHSSPTFFRGFDIKTHQTLKEFLLSLLVPTHHPRPHAGDLGSVGVAAATVRSVMGWDSSCQEDEIRWTQYQLYGEGSKNTSR